MAAATVALIAAFIALFPGIVPLLWLNGSVTGFRDSRTIPAKVMLAAMGAAAAALAAYFIYFTWSRVFG